MTYDAGTDTSRAPVPAVLIGGLGVVPFVVGVVIAWTQSAAIAVQASEIVVACAAVIMSFIGGIHWGFAARADLVTAARPAVRLYVIGVLPGAVAWGTLLLPIGWAVPLLAFTFASVLRIDQYALGTDHAPRWWMTLRVPLTISVIACLLAIWLAPSMRGVFPMLDFG